MSGSFQLRFGPSGSSNTHLAGRNEQSTGLSAVDLCQLLLGKSSPLPKHIQILTAAHAINPYSPGQDFSTRSFPLNRKRRPKNRSEGFRLKRISGQRCGAFSIHDMVGGLPATQGIVVHARQIIMNETIRMEHFNGAGNRHGRLHISTDKTAKFQNQYGSNSLSAGKQTVPHGLTQTRLRQICGDTKVLIQRSFDLSSIVFCHLITAHLQTPIR